MSKLYALFVGIDEYQAVTPLRGCVRDVEAIEALVRERVPAEALDVRSLTNDQATRAAIIDGFRAHLGRAGADDAALFYYCGHGSTENCPPEWARLEPSGQIQTLVPTDARTPGVYDLADKELAALLDEVAATGTEVVVITDSCHSAGSTRDSGDDDGPIARMTPGDPTRMRTLDDYLPRARALHEPERVLRHGRPAPRHVAIAACQGSETAQEFTHGTVRRGVFSLSLEEAVRTLGPTATYTDLVNSVRQKVRGRAQAQVPALSVVGGASRLQRFLGGRVGRADLLVSADAEGRWWLSAGAVTGLPADGAGVEVAVFEREAVAERGREATPVATATIAELAPDRAQLAVTPTGAPLDPARPYAGSVTRLGSPALHAVVVPNGADAASADEVRALLRDADPLLEVVDAPGDLPHVRVLVGNRSARLADAAGAPYPGLDYPLDAEGLNALAGAAAHAARWHRLRDLAPNGSRLNGAVRVELVPVRPDEDSVPNDRPPHEPHDGRVELTYDADGYPPVVVCRLRNGAAERLYVACYDLTDSFASVVLFADWIEPRAVGYALGGQELILELPAWKPATRMTDRAKVLACVEPFDPESWAIPALIVPPPSGTRDLMVQPAGRQLPRTADGARAFWGTSLLTIETSTE